MFQKINQEKFSQGFSLLEALIAIFCLVVISLGIYGMMVLGIRVAREARLKVAAAALANEEIEMARNLPYNDVGTYTCKPAYDPGCDPSDPTQINVGVPPGSILAREDVERSNATFHVNVDIRYVDDPFDGTAGGDPNDNYPNDYKRVRVEISWTSRLVTSPSIVFVTNVSPPSPESGEGLGSLLVNVIDAYGSPVPQTSVHIFNTAVDPNIDVVGEANDQGQYMLAGTPASQESYEIEVTKDGYTTDRTGDYPYHDPYSVVEGGLSSAYFTIDQVSSLAIDSVSESGVSSYVDPDGETQAQWLNMCGMENNYECINPGIREPANPGETDYVYHGGSGSDEIATDIYAMGTQAGVSNITTIKVWVYGTCSGSPGTYTDVDIYMGGAWQGSKRIMNENDSGTTWRSVEWTGNWEQSDLDNLQVNLTGAYPAIGGSSAIYALYTEVIQGTASALPNIPFHLSLASGHYDEDLQTDASGHLGLEDLHWGSYTVSIPGTSGYDLSKSNPPNPFTIDPGTENTLVMTLVPHADNTLLVTVRDGADVPIPEASVNLVGTGYDETILAGDTGQAFFTPLETGDYTLTVTKTGFEDYTEELLGDPPEDPGISGNVEHEATLNSI